MSQALQEKPRWVNGKKVDCNLAQEVITPNNYRAVLKPNDVVEYSFGTDPEYSGMGVLISTGEGGRLVLSQRNITTNEWEDNNFCLVPATNEDTDGPDGVTLIDRIWLSVDPKWKKICEEYERDEMAKAKEIVKQTKTVKPTVDDIIGWGANSSYAVLYTVAQQCFPVFMRLDDGPEYLRKLHEEAKEKAKDGVAAVFANVGAQMSAINKDEEDEAVNEDDQSNEIVDKTGELVEAPENNEKKPETNLKRKNAMINGSTPKKAKQEDVITTVNALKHVQKMKANVAMINASDVEEMDNRN